MGIFAVDEFLRRSGFARHMITADRRNGRCASGFRDTFHHFDDGAVRIFIPVDGRLTHHGDLLDLACCGVFDPVHKTQVYGMPAVCQDTVTADNLER